MVPRRLLCLAISILTLTSCAEPVPPPNALVRITGAFKSADQPQSEGNATLGVEAGELASTGLAIVALDSGGRTLTTMLEENGTFTLEVRPDTSYTLNLLDTVRNIYLASFLYRSGSTVELALKVGESDIALGDCEVFNGEIWCDNGFFEPQEETVIEPPSDMYGRVRATLSPTAATSELVTSLLGGSVVEYDLAPNPLNRFHVALTRHTNEGCNPPLLGVAERIGNERYLYTDRTYSNDTCQATARFQVMCTKTAADRCVGFLRLDVVSSGSDCSAYPPTHVAEPVEIEVLERGIISCPLPPTCSGHTDCESGICNNDVGFCATAAETRSLRIHVFDVGNGQAVLAVTPSGKSILMDAGRPQSGRMVAAMIRRVVPRIDVFVLSHFDADHAGGAVPLMLGPDGYPGRRGVDDDRLNGVDDEGEIGAAGSDDLLPLQVLDRGLNPMPSGFDDYARILGSRRRQAVAGEVFDFGDGATMQVVTSNGRVAGGTGLVVDEENARSVGVVFRYGDFSMSNLGDLPAGGLGTHKMEQLVIPSVLDDLPIDVHFLSHHGSKASSPPELLRSLRPRVAVISVGDSDRCGAGFNSYGLPAQEVLDAVADSGSIQKIYQTGEGGASFSGNCIPEPNQVYPRNYRGTSVAFAYSVFTIDAYESRFRVRGLTFDDNYDAEGCEGTSCSSCPVGYLESPTEEGRCIVDPCIPDPCNSRGVCDFIEPEQFTCACEPHFGGDRCERCATGYDGPECDTCADGFLPDPAAPTECLDDPCTPDECENGRCEMLAGGGFSCECAPRWKGALCDECDTGYAGAECDTCAEGFIRHPSDSLDAPPNCIPNPCESAPCGEHGTCVALGPDTRRCDCEARWGGAGCDRCAEAYTGDDCDQCAMGFVQPAIEVENGTCIKDLCTAASCGGRGSCFMAEEDIIACDCDGNFTGPGCMACEPGYAGPNCETCAAGYHIEAGLCVPNRVIIGGALVTKLVWGEPVLGTDLITSVEVQATSTADSRISGISTRLCWKAGTISTSVALADLTCTDASYRGKSVGGNGEEYRAVVTFPFPGLFRFIALLSGDGGQTWMAVDQNGLVGQNISPGIADMHNIGNGGFETVDGPLAQWTADLGIDVEAEPDFVHSGALAVRLTRISTVNADADFTAAPYPVVAGKSYNISMWFYDRDTSARGNVIYTFYDASNAIVGSTSFGGVYTADSPSWQNITRQVTAPANATSVRVSTRVYSQSGGAATGGSIVLDDVAIVPLGP
jgi:competence protein ComEC